ncbi:MAG TPA: prephenate dehydrogenase/arogenate dehydrogenase family protein, partial [Arenimonas sp.]|nr:prephenate dehydrogenase/arogenate dehydrogenase family protein [Arenimonas sp.]
MKNELANISKLNCVVFGGGNGWGKCIAETFTALKATVRIIEKDSTEQEIISAIQTSDIVFIAIPDSDIDTLFKKYGHQLHGKILLDCATNKAGFSDALHKLAKDDISVCSTHPMAASNGVLRGQNCLIMPIGKNSGPAENIALQLFQKLGMQCALFDFNKHTEAMAILQMLPHLMQRLTIDVLGQGISEYEIRIDSLANLASANYLLAELGLGRVAVQRADVSAGIIATALHEPFGQQLLEHLQTSLQNIKRAHNSRATLTNFFTDSMQQLDPSGEWRAQMANKTEAALIRLGNLRSRFLTIQAPNRIGMLRDILSVLAKHGIDMTALDSQLVQEADGREMVNFDIAISNELVPFKEMIEELAAI